jgi:hypothetical protein
VADLRIKRCSTKEEVQAFIETQLFFYSGEDQHFSQLVGETRGLPALFKDSSFRADPFGPVSYSLAKPAMLFGDILHFLMDFFPDPRHREEGNGSNLF